MSVCVFWSISSPPLEGFDSNLPPNQDLPTVQHRTFPRPWTILHAIHTDVQEFFRQRASRAPSVQLYFTKLMAGPNSGTVFVKIDNAQAKRDSTTTHSLQVLSRIWRVHFPPKIGFVAKLDDLERIGHREARCQKFVVFLCLAGPLIDLSFF